MNMPLYDTIGRGYNQTRMADPHIATRFALLLDIKSKGKYLDIGCGTGNYTLMLHSMGIDIVGADPSEAMLSIARSRNDQINWLHAHAEQFVTTAGTFDGILAMLTIHHWKDLQQGLYALSQSLLPGGKMVVFTATPAQMEGYWLNHYFPLMMRRSIDAMYSIDQMMDAAMGAGLQITATEPYFVQEDLQDQFLYVGKHNPMLYFEEQIQNGISSFSIHANADEVERGLAALKTDIENGTFPAIRERYANDLGDYLFITMKKNS
jgi:ubiquinone/menaquinone biosynthesis C-methylase UbiE